MPMRLVGKDKLQEFVERHPATKSWVEAWTKEVEAAQWRRPQDVKDRYASASIIDNTTVIFNVKGNAFRMEVRISYQTGVVLVVRCGTHAEYDRWK
jgi:mRNA interferase HigB